MQRCRDVLLHMVLQQRLSADPALLLESHHWCVLLAFLWIWSMFAFEVLATGRHFLDVFE